MDRENEARPRDRESSPSKRANFADRRQKPILFRLGPVDRSHMRRDGAPASLLAESPVAAMHAVAVNRP
jgi:hypothetical protein